MMANYSFNSREVNFYKPSVQYTRARNSSDQGSMDESSVVMSDEGFDTDESDYLMRPNGTRPPNKSGIGYFLTQGWKDACSRCCDACWAKCRRKREYKPRTIWLGRASPTDGKFPANVIRNQKYNIITFIPLVLFEQFKFFLNFYFLGMASSQFIPEIRVGNLYTYWGPLTFVILVTMSREAVDDFRRFCRDREVNGQKYKKLTKKGLVSIPSSKIRVGDIILVEKNQRVPADMVLLRTSEKNGSVFVRTDQLDGETDWKLRLAVPTTQRLTNDQELLEISAQAYAEKPQKAIHHFVGTFIRNDTQQSEDSLDIENTLWANTVIASGSAFGVVVYTGYETRSVMNTSKPKMKVGRLDLEINTLTKLLFFLVLVLSVIMVSLKGFGGPWYRYLFRFVVLFSYIIPISLRVNLDMGKVVYSWFIMHDKNMPGTVVRNTTIPEELGRIQYLLSDKTGTLTQNEMIFKKLHLGTVAFGTETMDEVKAHVRTSFAQPEEPKQQVVDLGPMTTPSRTQPKVRKTVISRVHEAVEALALCHNVTPVYEDSASENSDIEADQQIQQTVTYQAASPDEVALVSWTEEVGLALVKRNLNSMTLRTPTGKLLDYEILQIFPFTSESKRMGIIVKDVESGEITFYMKGADVVMTGIVQYNDWLEEECGNMAREGLRTLVVAKKTLTEDQYQDFEILCVGLMPNITFRDGNVRLLQTSRNTHFLYTNRYSQAKLSVHERNAKVAAVVESLERDMELLCLTGVEDKLQENVRPTLELLRNAGIKIWMLTGDKLETAECIAKSSRLVSRTQGLHTFRPVTSRSEAHLELNSFRRKNDCALIIRGDSLEVCLKFYMYEFVELACQCPAVVVCRCSPTQKAEIVKLLKTHTEKITCAIGDGGNDVSMIQAANAGIGIVGKEGKQASLAADFSITQFSHVGRLLVVHGRNSYKRSSALAQFVIHRGLIISTMQAVFSSVFYFSSVSLFPGFLMIGYATVFTMFPVFSLVLDKDVTSEIAMTFPELYKELMKGRSLNYKTFFMWVVISIYQGGIIMYGAFLLFDQEFIHVVAITFTSLILTELLMVALTIRTWHWLMVFSELFSLAWYVVALVVFKESFDPQFLKSWDFVWKVVVITSISCIPLYILKYLRRRFSPPSYSKLT